MNRKQLSSPLKITVYKAGNVIFEQKFNEYPITIGRSSKADIPLTDFDFLSRQHCCVTVENNEIQIVDLDSSNGMYFEGKKAKQLQIEKNIEITIGKLLLKFELEDSQLISERETIVDSKPGKLKELPSLNQIPLKQTSEHTHTEGSTTQRLSEDGLEKKSLPEISNKKTNDLSTQNQKKKKISEKEKPIHVHQMASQLRPQQRVLESYVTWHDQIYSVQQYYPGQHVVLGHGEEANLDVPVLKGAFPVAHYDGQNTQIIIPDKFSFELERADRTLDFKEISNEVSHKNNSYALKLGASELLSLKISKDVAVHFRYAPAPRQLSKTVDFLKDEELKKPGIVVGFVELVILMVIMMTETKDQRTPQKVMQERVARLIVQPKKEEPPPPPEPPKVKPPEIKVAEKKEPPKPIKKQPKPQKIVKLQKSKLLAKVNKYPVEVEKPLRVAEKPVVANVQQIGALAALNAFSSSAPQTNQPVAININKNAGGQTALNTGGVIGTLKTNSGKLAAGGFASVKTKGLGYGTGTGYGVQGIKGTAGGRSVAGTVVGQPKLVKMSKEEGLTRQQVMDVVKRYMGQIQQCYERSLIENPSLAGRAEYEWEITPNGSVQWAKVKKTDVSSGDSLNNCVVGIFKQMKFPQAKNGQNTIPNIGFPFGRI